MNNSQLNEILKRAGVPERPKEFWEQFPAQVTAEAARRERNAAKPVVTFAKPMIPPAWRLAFGTAFAVLVVLAVGLLLLPSSRLGGMDQHLAAAEKYFREIQPLFPNQLAAIEFDSAGAHLKLSDRPDVAPSPPLYVSVCTGRGCRRFVTFSGQAIRVNGDVFEVLLDRRGEVLVVGKQWVWPDPSRDKSAPYRIEARPLPITS